MRQPATQRRKEPKSKPKDRFVGISMSHEEFLRLKATADKVNHGNVAWFIRKLVRQAVEAQGL